MKINQFKISFLKNIMILKKMKKSLNIIKYQIKNKVKIFQN